MKIKKSIKYKIKNKIESYNLPPCPLYRYATIPYSKKYKNENFDNLLLMIGKYCFDEPIDNYNAICRRISKEINKTWHLNRIRKIKQGKRVSATQIKTFRHTFNKILNNEEKYIRLPFHAVPILFFILRLFASIDHDCDTIRALKNQINDTSVGNTLYPIHTSAFITNYPLRITQIMDPNLQTKYNLLYAHLTSSDSIMLQRYSNIDWNTINQYKIK